MTTTSYLRIDGVTKRFGGTVALRNVSLEASLGEVLALVGENGAGKSTLMNVLSGAIRADSGTIWLDGRPVVLGSPHEAGRHGVRAVHQEFSLVPHLTIAENMLMGRLPTLGRGRLWVDWTETNRRAQKLVSELGFKDLDVRSRVSRLSISHQQIVEIAKALSEKPRLLILDEPSAVLSKEELERLFALIRMLRREGALVLYISHRLEEVFEIADRITVLRDGEVVGTVVRAEVSQDDLIRMMVGRSVEEIYPRRLVPIGTEILSVKGLSQAGRFRDVTFSVARGEVLGMFGLVGSGRSEIARCLFGAALPTAGTITLEGKEVRLRSPQDAVGLGISLVTEDRKRDGLVFSCSVRDNVSLASLRQMSHGIFLDRRRQDEAVTAKVEELSIRTPSIATPVKTLSGGNQQKVVLAKWLLSRTRVLILDEPTRGVDIGAKVEIYHIINDLARSGVAVLLISSEMAEVLGMSDRILVMREGRLMGVLARSEANEERVLQYAAGAANGNGAGAGNGAQATPTSGGHAAAAGEIEPGQGAP